MDNVKEKLVALLIEEYKYGTYEDMADGMIAAGVTFATDTNVAGKEVDAKPLTAFLSPIDAYKGLKRKFLVFKSDTGEIVENCFVLRPDKDPAAVEALRAYARATDNATLSADIVNWVGEGEERRWIPVTERLPDEDVRVIVRIDRTVWNAAFVLDADRRHNGEWVRWGRAVTNWMPMPEAAKEG